MSPLLSRTEAKRLTFGVHQFVNLCELLEIMFALNCLSGGDVVED
jgi:hypothetical protein